MRINNKLNPLFWVFIIVGLAYAAHYGYRYASVGAGYNAKMVCSCVFVAGRDQKTVEMEELYAVPFGKQVVDKEHNTVTASIFGIVSKTAMYRPKLGCTLLNDATAETLRQQPAVIGATAQTENWADSTLPAAQKTALQKIVDGAFAEPDPKNPVRTRAVLVLHRGRVVAEQYASGFTQNTPLMGWSMTKSVTNAMIGLLVKDGKIDVNKPAPVAEWTDNRRAITTDNLLRMSSGLNFEENYGKISDATKMLFLENGAGKYALGSKVEVAPATKWYYSSGTTNVLQEIVRRQFKTHAEYLNFPHQRLFQKLGMASAVIEPDASGTYVGSSFMFATARDWAKFGQLYAQDGIWQNERLLPEGWVKYSSTETPHANGDYAAQFWTYCRKNGVPPDAFSMNGFEGQYVLIVPSKQLVVVRLGCSPNEALFDEKRFFKEVAAIF
ncbi:MAG: class C beta-lactamase-related serine hydrolase [Cytophagia bacterium]|nr:MAG: class C beta-lactamase-related serine hydrolase [Cytophagales bacterium]TAG36033.1 MAG: class C beta-lactamase-related serine hydrolase [Cytophagia bacterium]TAG73922.1 MAG: class C beta-lactamase-related serine hydrolase [Runella slithyformis]TAG77712.1 MAG: class C beta-lactamase-related serine hydrolase [Cytophagales bacterium]